MWCCTATSNIRSPRSGAAWLNKPSLRRAHLYGAVDDPGWWRPQQQQQRVLVGFARAVTDASMVGIVHDVCVMPELRGRGLGKQLLDRLTKQVGR